MALFPCDEGGHRYPGRSQSVYLAVLDGGTSWRRKFRFCQRHFVAFEAHLRQSFRDANDSFEEGHQALCPSCHSPVESGNAACFATIYATGMDRLDLWAPVCEDHVFPLRVAWGMDPEPPRISAVTG